MKIEIEREDDGRRIAEVLDLPGVMVYERSREATLFYGQVGFRLVSEVHLASDDEAPLELVL